MADYIYLLQNRLNPAQLRALEAVREAARSHSLPVFLVGGAVRDLTTGAPVRDLDFAVQGDPRSLVADLEAAGATVAGESKVLESLYLTFPGGVRVEAGPTLSVTYPKPGQPVAQQAAILDDLRRRDFTANSMAVSLNEGSYGLLLDPLNGTADIENRELRLVSPYGFIEQPALLLRAARLSERLGWSLEERTQSRYETSKEENHIEALPEADRGYELEEIFHEEDPLAIIEHMTAEGWRDVLFPGLTPDGADRKAIDEVRDLVGQLEGQSLHPDPSAVLFPLLTAKMAERDREALKALFPRQGFVRQIETLEARSKELASQLTSKAAALPSETWKLLHAADAEVVLYLAYSSRSGAVQTKLKGFLKDWPQQRQKLPYALMQEMRITPELPGYQQLLQDLFFALIDGKLDTPEATRAFLEPFSPPAPPQVNVRRRPAKSAKGRPKRAAGERASEAEDLGEEPTRSADDEEDEDDEEDDSDRRKSKSVRSDDEDEDDEEEESAAPVRNVSATKDLDDAEEPESAMPEAPAPAHEPEIRSAPAKASVPIKPVKTSTEKTIAAEKPAPASKKTAAGKPAAAPTPSSAASKPAKAVTVAAPAKTAPSVVAKKAPAKAAPAPAKAAVPATKSVPVKAIPVAVSSKAAAAKQPTKAAKAPAKVIVVKQAKKAAPAKASSQKVASKSQPPAASKKAIPAKAVKAATKGRSR